MAKTKQLILKKKSNLSLEMLGKWQGGEEVEQVGSLVLMVTRANRRLQTASRLDPGPGHSLGLAPCLQPRVCGCAWSLRSLVVLMGLERLNWLLAIANYRGKLSIIADKEPSCGQWDGRLRATVPDEKTQDLMGDHHPGAETNPQTNKQTCKMRPASAWALLIGVKPGFNPD